MNLLSRDFFYLVQLWLQRPIIKSWWWFWKLLIVLGVVFRCIFHTFSLFVFSHFSSRFIRKESLLRLCYSLSQVHTFSIKIICFLYWFVKSQIECTRRLREFMRNELCKANKIQLDTRLTNSWQRAIKWWCFICIISSNLNLLPHSKVTGYCPADPCATDDAVVVHSKPALSYKKEKRQRNIL